MDKIVLIFVLSYLLFPSIMLVLDETLIKRTKIFRFYHGSFIIMKTK